MLDSETTDESEKKIGKRKRNERERKREREKRRGCTLRVSHVLLGANVVHRVLTYTSVQRERD